MNKLVKKIKAYKAVNKRADGKYDCRGFIYEVGKLYEHEKKLEMCSSGFHCCEKGVDVYNYYTFGDNTEVFEVEIPKGAVIKKDGDKICTNKIKLIKSLHSDEKGFNTGDGNTGYGNTGDGNTGGWNTGYGNTGDRNTGDRNTGYGNTGDRNTGYGNTGGWNTGYGNTGYGNTGYGNTGDGNTGDGNTGYGNTGDRNTGDRNTGDRNTGYGNTGGWNTCNFQTGFFNTIEQPVALFNGAISIMRSELKANKGYNALLSVPLKLTKWTENSELPDNEKSGEHTGGRTTRIGWLEAHKEWWANMSITNKKLVKTLPGFDAAIFKEITGVDVNE